MSSDLFFAYAIVKHNVIHINLFIIASKGYESSFSSEL